MRVLSELCGSDPCIARVSDHSAKEGNYEWITRKKEREKEKERGRRRERKERKKSEKEREEGGEHVGAAATKLVCRDNRTKYNNHYAIIVL